MKGNNPYAKMSTSRKIQIFVLILAIACTSAAGIYFIRSSHAASAVVSTEPENGVLTSPATAKSDVTASAGSYVQFGAAVTPPPPPPPGVDPVIAVAGDIACEPNDPNWNAGKGNAAGCGGYGTAQKVLALKPTAVLTLGDNQYVGGELANFQKSYAPTWGQFKSITHPTLGNHEYGTGGAAGYFSYFGTAATPTAPTCRTNCGGYYSFDIGTWHMIALNSECTFVPGGCNAGSPQETWLKADLAAHSNKCTLAFWHEPYWATGTVLRTDLVLPFIKDLYAANADLILNGHSHSYSSWGPMDPTGKLDTARGVRELIAGTGGKEFTGTGANKTNLLKDIVNSFGILSVTLHPSSFDWKYIPSTGTQTDSGSASCH